MLAVCDRGAKSVRTISKPDFISKIFAKIKNHN